MPLISLLSTRGVQEFQRRTFKRVSSVFAFSFTGRYSLNWFPSLFFLPNNLEVGAILCLGWWGGGGGVRSPRWPDKVPPRKVAWMRIIDMPKRNVLRRQGNTAAFKQSSSALERQSAGQEEKWNALGLLFQHVCHIICHSCLPCCHVCIRSIRDDSE